MKAHLHYLLFKIRESFWFLPILMVIAAIATSRIALSIDRFGSMKVVTELFWFGAPDIESSRLILSTVSGAMITTASLVFSLTLVSLTLASQQLGPRLLSMFLRDRMTQVVLGLFLSTFIYALIVLMALGGVEVAGSVPIFAMTIAIAATIASFVALIVFIHHLATSLQADVVVARVASELLKQVEQHFPARADAGESKEADEPQPPLGGTMIESDGAGYIQAIDQQALLCLAVDHHVCIELLHRPGHFASRGEPIAVVHPERPDVREIRDALCQAIVFGNKRTQAQDPELALLAIVEIALRALSPGINDPHTAMTCVDRLSEALASIFERRFPVRVHYDDGGTARLFANGFTVDGLIDLAFDEIRQFTAENFSVTVRMAHGLRRLANAARTPQQRAAIRRHCELLARASERMLEDQADLEKVKTALQQVGTVLLECGDGGRDGRRG